MSARTTPPESEVAVGGGLYERKATGLVRSISLRSGIYFNVITVGVMWSVLSLTQIAGGFVDANPLVTAVLALVLCAFPVLLYGIFTATVPRSGGDYVWIGRTFHPWLGLAANVNATIWFVLGNGLLAYLVSQDALPTAFATLGSVFGSETLTSWSTGVTSSGWTFVIGLAVLVGFGVLTQAVSMRKAMRVVFGFFLVTMIGLIVAILVLAFSSRGDFSAVITTAGGSYDGVLEAARAGGLDTGASWSLWASLLAMPPLYLALAYTVGAAYTGGEVRRPQVTGIVAPLAAMLLVGGLVVIAFALVGSVIGFRFISAASFLSASGAEGYPLDAAPGFFPLVTALTGSDIVQLIIAVAYVAAPLSTILATVLFATRNVFAWSFDRMLPAQVAAVGRRTGTPVVAPMIITALAAVYLAFLVWGSPTFSAALGAIILGTTVSFMITAIAGIAFPILRPDMFEASGVRWRIGGVPALSVVAAVAFVVYALMLYSLLTQDALGSNNSTAIGAMIIVAAIALVLYPIAYAANRRNGVDVSLAGRELPPE
jgi:APA family basic amino acid/polyamine antiporter